MPRNRYSSALLFDNPSISLHATTASTAATIKSDDDGTRVLDMQKDRGQSQSAQIPHASRAIHVLHHLQQTRHLPDAVLPQQEQAQSIRAENRARSELRDFSKPHLAMGASSAGSLKATVRKPVTTEASRVQSNRLLPSTGVSHNPSVPSDHAPSRVSIATQETQIYSPIPVLNSRFSTVSHETQIYNPLPSIQSNPPDTNQSSKDVSSNRSLGKKPPPIPPGNAVRRPFLRKRSVADTVSILGTPLPLDASVNLAYHELLKESSGSEVHEVPKTLRNSMVSLHHQNGREPPQELEREMQTEKVLPPDPVSDHDDTSTLRQSFDVQSPPAQEGKHSELETAALTPCLPKRLPRNREAMRKELNAILDSSQRNALPVEPMRSVSDSAAGESLRTSPHSSTKSRPMSQQLLSIGPSYSMSSVPRPTSGGVSPLSTPDPSLHRRSRSVSLTSTIHLSPPMHPPPSNGQSQTCPSALAPAFPASASRDPTSPSSALSHARSHSNIGLLPSLLGPPSPSLRPSPVTAKDQPSEPHHTRQETRNHRHTISNPTSLLSPFSPPLPSQPQTQTQSPLPSYSAPSSPQSQPQSQPQPAPFSPQLSMTHSISSASSSSLSVLSSSSLTEPYTHRPNALSYARGGIESSPDSPHSLFLPLSTDDPKKTAVTAPTNARNVEKSSVSTSAATAAPLAKHHYDDTTLSDSSSDSLSRKSTSSSDSDSLPRALPDKTARDLADLLPDSAPMMVVLPPNTGISSAEKQWEDKKKTKDRERQRRKSMRVLGISESESKGVGLDGIYGGVNGSVTIGRADAVDDGDDAQPPPIARSRRRDGEKGRGMGIEELVMAQQQQPSPNKGQGQGKGGSKVSGSKSVGGRVGSGGGGGGGGAAMKGKVDVRAELRAENMVSSMGMARRMNTLAAANQRSKEQGRNGSFGGKVGREDGGKAGGRERGTSRSGAGGWFGSLRNKVGLGRDRDRDGRRGW